MFIQRLSHTVIYRKNTLYVSEQFLLRDNHLLLVHKYINPAQEYRLAFNFFIV